MSAITITIPWRVDRALSPNARGHWTTKHRATQEARAATTIAMRTTLDLEDPVACFQTARWPLTLHYRVALGKGQRRMDDDNLIACMKPVRDQIAACLGMDDRDMETGTVRQDRDPAGVGYIAVTIAEGEPA